MAINSILPSQKPALTEAEENAVQAHTSGLRSEAMQRLQIGLSGIAGMLLLIGLAQVIFDKAKQTDAATVPAAAPTVSPSAVVAKQSDPLVEAGVVPDLPADPSTQTVRETAVVPEQGTPASAP